ncbi:MAG: cohesin domain-containing protein [Candidatus Pacebacteria bacterium]|nr:cohesin domain-containing protein [Candidatus Paceibacterota bacterium]
MRNKKIFLIIITIATCILFFDVKTILAQPKAATLYIDPATGVYKEEQVFKVKIKVNTGGYRINSARGIINFPKEKLEILDIERGNSIFSLWDSSTHFSNYEGNISFGGGLPAPGFSGNSGEILEISFRAKSTGKVNLDFQEGSVLANDAKGTDILRDLEGAEYNLNKEKVPIPTKKKTEIKRVQAPQITTYPEKLSSTEVFFVEGKADSKLTIILYIEKEGVEPIIATIKVDSDNTWSYVHNRFLRPGKYHIYAKAKNEKGEISAPSKKITLTLERGGVVVLGKFIREEIIYGSIILFLSITLFILLTYFLYNLQKRAKKRMNLLKEIKEANDSVIDGFGLLKEEVSREMKALKDMDITKDHITEKEKEERQKLVNDLIEDLDLIEKIQNYIRKEIGDIEKVLPPIR